MQTIISNISRRIRQVYQKAEGFIEDEREFPLSQVFLNATFQRFVTDNVKALKICMRICMMTGYAYMQHLIIMAWSLLCLLT